MKKGGCWLYARALLMRSYEVDRHRVRCFSRCRYFNRYLQDYIKKRYHGRHGAVSITVEDAVREFLDKQDKPEKAE